MLVLLNGALLLLIAAAIVAEQVLDRNTARVEAAVRGYAAAVTDEDLDAALAELAPEARAGWAEWVGGQLGNIYEVRTVSVRATRFLGRPIEATAVMEVNRGYPDEHYQANARVAVVEEGGRWYLQEPLLAAP